MTSVAPHFPQLPTAPNHLHDGSEENVLASPPMSITEVLDELLERMERETDISPE